MHQSLRDAPQTQKVLAYSSCFMASFPEKLCFITSYALGGIRTR